MNIFVLSTDPAEAAELQCDKHVVKMILETVQLLCTVKHLYNEPAHYKPTHKNHPCTKWAAESKENFEWLKKHGLALCREYTFRYGRIHKAQSILESLEPPDNMPSLGLTPFVKAMPSELQEIKDPVEAYKAYYRKYKRHFASWTKRPEPDFMKE